MLVLTRKEGEKILIGDNVVLEVIGIKGSTMRIGITAPRDLPIVRSELKEETKPEPDDLPQERNAA